MLINTNSLLLSAGCSWPPSRKPLKSHKRQQKASYPTTKCPFFIENIYERAFLQHVTSRVHDHTDSSLLATSVCAHINKIRTLSTKNLTFSVSFTHLLYRICQFNWDKNHQERTLGASNVCIFCKFYDSLPSYCILDWRLKHYAIMVSCISWKIITWQHKGFILYKKTITKVSSQQ